MEIDEPTTKKIRECGAKETQFSLILVIKVSCLIFPITTVNLFFMKILEQIIQGWSTVPTRLYYIYNELRLRLLKAKQKIQITKEYK